MKPLAPALLLAALATPATVFAKKKDSPRPAHSMTHPALDAQQLHLLAYCIELATAASGFRVSDTEAFSPFVCLIDPQGKTSSDVLVGKHAEQVQEYLGNLFAQIPAEMGTPAVVTSGQVKRGDDTEQVMDIFVLNADRHTAVHFQGVDVPKPPPTPQSLKRLGELRLAIKK